MLDGPACVIFQLVSALAAALCVVTGANVSRGSAIEWKRETLEDHVYSLRLKLSKLSKTKKTS